MNNTAMKDGLFLKLDLAYDSISNYNTEQF